MLNIPKKATGELKVSGTSVGSRLLGLRWPNSVEAAKLLLLGFGDLRKQPSQLSTEDVLNVSGKRNGWVET